MFRPSNFTSWLVTAIVILAASMTFLTVQLYGQAYNTFVTSSSLEQFLKSANESDRVIQASVKTTWAATTKKEREQAEARELSAKETAEIVKIADIQQATAIDSSTCNASSTHNNPASVDVIVNKKHCIQPLTFVPTDLVTSNGATLKAEASAAFDSLLADSVAAGLSIYATSSYRSYESQVSTYNYWVGISGKEGADTYSARPGYSEHQTGLSVDVASPGCVLDCFGTTSAYQWMLNNAAKYGFIQRYYSGYETITGYTAEEWHYRFVGVEVAQDMKNKGIKTLEEYWGVSGGTY